MTLSFKRYALVYVAVDVLLRLFLVVLSFVGVALPPALWAIILPAAMAAKIQGQRQQTTQEEPLDWRSACKAAIPLTGYGVAMIVAVSVVSAVISGGEGDLQALKIMGVWYWVITFIVIAAVTYMSSALFFRSGFNHQVRARAKANAQK